MDLTVIGWGEGVSSDVCGALPGREITDTGLPGGVVQVLIRDATPEEQSKIVTLGSALGWRVQVTGRSDDRTP